MKPSGAWGYGLIGFTLILLIRGWAHGGGFTLILASLFYTVQAITEGVCVCVCVCVSAHLLACPGRWSIGWLGGLGKRHTRCYLCDLFTLTSLEVIPGCLLVEDVKASGQTWLCLRVGTYAMYSAWRSWQFIVGKNLKTVIASFGFTFSLCNQYGNW